MTTHVLVPTATGRLVPDFYDPRCEGLAEGDVVTLRYLWAFTGRLRRSSFVGVDGEEWPQWYVCACAGEHAEDAVSDVPLVVSDSAVGGGRWKTIWRAEPGTPLGLELPSPTADSAKPEGN